MDIDLFINVSEYEGVKEGIWAAGGIPVEFGIPATCGNVANGADEMKYEQVGRDIVAMSIEFVSRVHNFDAICCVASCDLIIAGCYLAACRLDIPAMVVTGGSMQAGNYCGKTVVEADLDSARFSGASEEELMEMEECVCPSFGACPSMGTANTMQMLGEVLNLVMPGTSTIPASDNARLRAARAAGKYMVKMAKEGRTPKDIITKDVLENAIMFDMAVAGSTNAVLHLLAYAYELGIELTLADFEKYAKEIYCINAVIPSGPYTVVDLHYSGGVKGIMKQLESKLHTDAPTIYGNTWGDILATVKPQTNEVIHSLDNPVAKEPGLKILRGNISPAGAIVRPTAVFEEVMYIKGKAKVFEGDQPAYDAIMAGEIVPGDIIVIRYEGCKGAPGMKELMLSIDALIAKDLHKSVGLITDARFSGFNYGAIVGHVSPEAYDGGVIALIENGDEIEMDIAGGNVNLLVSDEVLAERRKNWVRPALKQEKGVLKIYAENCRPAEQGGAMQPWDLSANYNYHHV